jgi:general stress protein 26
MRSHGFYISRLFTAVALIVAIGAPAIAVTSQRDADALSNASYIYIATVRKDGNQSKAARVWFVTAPDGQILIDTNSTSWKAKRIARGSPVIVWIGSADGPAFIGKAKIEGDRAIQDHMIEAIPKKYFLARMGFFGPKRENFDSGKIVTIRIYPARDLPEGFQSQPGTPAPALDVKEPPPRVPS